MQPPVITVTPGFPPDPGPSWTDIIVALTAAYAAILSTYTFLMERRSRLKTILVQSTPGRGILSCEAVSHSDKTYMLVDIGFRVKGVKGEFIISQSGSQYSGLPAEMTHSRRISVLIDFDDMKKALKDQPGNTFRIKPFFLDTFGNRHYDRNWFTFDRQARTFNA